MSAYTVTAENPAAEPAPKQQGWTEISCEEITEFGLDPWDPGMGDTDKAEGEMAQAEQSS